MKPRFALLIAVGLGLAGAAGLWAGRGGEAPAGGAEAERQLPASVASARGLSEVPSHRGQSRRGVATGFSDHDGKPVSVACMTCHATREPGVAQGAGGATPREFHPGLTYAHGGQSCLSCHNTADYDTLRLADGRRVAFGEAQKLCAQCHGPQTRDYLHGSHGGMTGYWDKTKGARVRNTCTDCHDPHAPGYPAWTPVFPPRDAAARQQAEREERSGTPPSHE